MLNSEKSIFLGKDSLFEEIFIWLKAIESRNNIFIVKNIIYND